MIGALGLKTDARAVVNLETSASRLFGGHFQPSLTSLDPLETLLVHCPSGSTQHAVIRR